MRVACSIRAKSTRATGRLPLIVNILKRCSSSRGPLERQGFVDVSGSGFSRIVTSVDPGTRFVISDILPNARNGLSIRLGFGYGSSFSPSGIVRRISYLEGLSRLHSRLYSLQGEATDGRGLGRGLRRLLIGAGDGPRGSSDGR